MLNLKQDFPETRQKINGKPLIYLDSGASTLKPQVVVDRLQSFYSQEASNVHRGAHRLSAQATEHYENSRNTIANFINAKPEEIIFTRGTTESLNLVASSFGELLDDGDEIVLTKMEHHSNIVPWQLLAKRKKIKIKWANVDSSGRLDLDHFKSLFNERTKLTSFSSVSNALGTVHPAKEMIAYAKTFNTIVVLDAAQAMTCEKIDVVDLDCDFLAFSGHKIFAPTGVGVLFGKAELLKKMPPYQSGGSMISEVSTESSTFLEAPQKFEAGTPAIAEAVALGTAIEYLQKQNFSDIQNHEKSLIQLLVKKLKEEVGDVIIYAEDQPRINVLSFNLKDIHPSDVSSLLDEQGVAVRTGHHCCQPLMKELEVSGTIRACVSIYSTESDILAFIEALKKVKSFF